MTKSQFFITLAVTIPVWLVIHPFTDRIARLVVSALFKRLRGEDDTI